MNFVQREDASTGLIKTQVLKIVCEKRTFSARLIGVTGPVVILLHGFPDNYLTFGEQVPALIAAGYRVLLPVLPGYEPASVDPDGHYFVTDLVRWLMRWVDQLDVGKVHLAGHDWGAVIGWMAAALHPERFQSFTAIAIPSLHHMPGAVVRHPSQLLKSWYMGFFQFRGVAERSLQWSDGWLIRRLWKNWSPGWEGPRQHIESVCQQLLQPDVQKAALGYYRCLFRFWASEHRESRLQLRHKVTIPTLMISGANDGCMDTRLFDEVLVEADFPGGIELYRLMGAGHFCHLEKPDLVNHKLTHFIRRCEVSSARAGSELAGHLG